MIVQHYQGRLKEICLDDDTTTNSFINEFNLCCQNLEKHGEGYTEKSKTCLFLNMIDSSDYEIVKTFIEAQIATISFYTVVKTIRSHELNLNRSSGKSAAPAATSCRAGKDLKGENDSSAPTY